MRGSVLVGGANYAGARGTRLRKLRREVQLVFQDPRASLSPRMTVGETIGEAIAVHRRMTREARRAEVARVLELVALDPSHADARPAALSGGQRQRVALARALAVRPSIVIADEVTASLDVSVQGSVLNLLRTLQRETGLSLLVISHNLAIVNYLCDQIAVMQLGRIVEAAPARELVEHPCHPYTRVLLDSVAPEDLDDAAPEAVAGDPPDPLSPPSGCRYRTLCPVGPLVNPDRSICGVEDPGAGAALRDHRAACHFVAHGHADAEALAHGR